MKQTDIKTVPFRGGANTVAEPALLEHGQYSMIQNMRQMHPGMKKRLGCSKLHTTADSTNKVLTLYQFAKGKKTERHFYGQFGDGDVLEATTAPPGVTTGAFGSEVFSGSSGQIPASWSTINDMMLYSNGVDQHQIYPGLATYVDKFIVYRGGAAIPWVPVLGEDYSEQVSDGLTTTAAILDSLGDLAVDYDCIFIMTKVPADSFTWTISLANATASTLGIKYWNGAWTGVSGLSDGTATGGATMAVTGGATSFTMPTDSIPRYMFGKCGFWHQVYLATGDLDSEVEVTTVTYESDFMPIQNVWDGIPVDCGEVQILINASTTYKTFGSTNIDVSALTSSDAVFFSTADLIEGFFVDMGDTPNTTGTTTISNAYYWNGSAWAAVSNLTDGSAGLSSSGWVTFTRPTGVQPLMFNESKYSSYWWKFVVDKTLSASLTAAITVQPYFSISEYGVGLVNASWKNRAAYAFSLIPNQVLISKKLNPLVLNGIDFRNVEIGDGRQNKIVAIRKFFNELMVWQEEIGNEGGTVTLIEGYSPATYGTVLLNSKLGALNSKSVAVVDGIYTSTRTDEVVKTVAFALSHYGVYMTDGTTFTMISDAIQNYFDPTDTTNCIRKGYEAEMWLKFDSSFNCLRLGLVCGASATVPNVFPVYDLTDKTWSFDNLAQEFSCMEEIEAGSGAVPILQVGGGVDDGYVYLANNGSNDVSTAIDAYATQELDFKGKEVNLDEILLRVKTQSAGNVTITPSLNGVTQTAITVPMTAAITNETLRKNRFPVNLTGNHVSMKFQNSTASQSIYLLDVGYKFKEYENQ